ncbi:hypothetical protein ACFL0T_08985, partial [Candidatus Omnitrophota bacterium]
MREELIVNIVAGTLSGGLAGFLSGLAVGHFTRKADRKELQRISLHMVKIKLEEYKKKIEAIGIDRLSDRPFNDDLTQETIREAQDLLIDIKKDLIHCPKDTQKGVLDFKELCKKKDQN